MAEGRLIARPGRLELTNRPATAGPNSYNATEGPMVQLWLNGASQPFAALNLSATEDLEATTAHGEVPHWWLATALMVGVVNQMRWARHRGAWGSADVLAGFAMASGSTISVSDSPGISLDGSSGSFVVSLARGVAAQDEVAVAARATAIVLQAGGVVAPDCIGLDGTVYSHAWRDSSYRVSRVGPRGAVFGTSPFRRRASHLRPDASLAIVSNRCWP